MRRVLAVLCSTLAVLLSLVWTDAPASGATIVTYHYYSKLWDAQNSLFNRNAAAWPHETDITQVQQAQEFALFGLLFDRSVLELSLPSCAELPIHVVTEAVLTWSIDLDRFHGLNTETAVQRQQLARDHMAVQSAVDGFSMCKAASKARAAGAT